jgi:hypothetical protein
MEASEARKAIKIKATRIRIAAHRRRKAKPIADIGTVPVWGLRSV